MLPSLPPEGHRPPARAVHGSCIAPASVRTQIAPHARPPAAATCVPLLGSDPPVAEWWVQRGGSVAANSLVAVPAYQAYGDHLQGKQRHALVVCSAAAQTAAILAAARPPCAICSGCYEFNGTSIGFSPSILRKDLKKSMLKTCSHNGGQLGGTGGRAWLVCCCCLPRCARVAVPLCA